MTGNATTRIISFILLVASSALGQARNKSAPLPAAPSAQTVNRSEIFRAFADTARLPVTTLPSTDQALSTEIEPKLEQKYDPFHLGAKQHARTRVEAETLSPWTPALLKRNTAFHTATGNTLLGRAAGAATSIVVTRDEEGNRSLNTPYLLRVLTIAAAHVGDRRYGRRTIGQPLSDFGSTLGNDAGINVLHEFQPGLLQLVKSHEPKFVSRIEHRARRK